MGKLEQGKEEISVGQAEGDDKLYKKRHKNVKLSLENNNMHT